MEESTNDPEIQSYVNKWEFLKYNVREYSISFSKEKAFMVRKEEKDLIKN